jgi:hypothetical protein
MLVLKLLSVVLTYCLLVKRMQVIEHSVPVCIYIARYREKYLKRRIVYSSGHPG